MRLVSWNLNNRKSKVSVQCEYLKGLIPDVVALQEVTPETANKLKTNLSDIGLIHSLHSFSSSTGNSLPKNRSLGVMIASRFSITESTRASTPWAEKTLSVALHLDSQDIDLHSAYIPPGSSNGWIKIDTIEGVVNRVLEPSKNLKILCGDFNCPQRELTNGTVITWGQKIKSDGSTKIPAHWNGQPGTRWVAVEESLFTTLAEQGIKDVYRKLNGFDSNGFSWVLTRKGKEFQRRYDHVFAAESLNPTYCDYVHEPRLAGYSDHSPILVDFNS
jgi:exonuclease III